LTQTLVAAERSAADARETARREAEVIVAEAHNEARSVMRGAQSERERLALEARRITTLMRSALGLLEEGAEAPEKWPDRGDTREFKAVTGPVAVDNPPVEVDEQPEEIDHPQASRDFNWG
jgi:cell division septum initiation protein DivIVA